VLMHALAGSRQLLLTHNMMQMQGKTLVDTFKLRPRGPCLHAHCLADKGCAGSAGKCSPTIEMHVVVDGQSQCQC
jgi:hypothetical protein